MRAFAQRYGLACTGAQRDLRVEGSIEGVSVSITKVRRGTGSSPRWATRFSAFANAPFAGNLVAFKPNFLIRLPGPRRISDDIGTAGLFGFVHRDEIGDAELDRKLIMQAEQVTEARRVLTRQSSKRAILAALDAVGHIRIQVDEVALERADRVDGFIELLETPEEIEPLALAAVAVVHALSEGGEA